MKAILTILFTFVSIFLLYVGVTNFLQYRDSFTPNYKYPQSEKGQIITIETSAFEFNRNGNNYDIIASSGEKISLDSVKYGLIDLFKDWKVQSKRDSVDVLSRPSGCNYLNFVLQSKQNSNLEDSLQYIYCSFDKNPEIETL